MNNFAVGELVVCVDAYCEELCQGRVYTVTYADFCCKPWIGIGIPDDGLGGCCSDCGAPDHGPHLLFESNAFRRLDKLEEQLHRIETERIQEPQLA